MASSAILRSAARALRLPPPLLEMRPRPLSSSSVPLERHKPLPSMDTSSRGRSNEAKEDIYERLSTKTDKILEGLERNSRLLKELEMQIKENKKHGRVIDLTPLSGASSALIDLEACRAPDMATTGLKHLEDGLHQAEHLQPLKPSSAHPS